MSRARRRPWTWLALQILGFISFLTDSSLDTVLPRYLKACWISRGGMFRRLLMCSLHLSLMLFLYFSKVVQFSLITQQNIFELLVLTYSWVTRIDKAKFWILAMSPDRGEVGGRGGGQRVSGRRLCSSQSCGGQFLNAKWSPIQHA